MHKVKVSNNKKYLSDEIINLIGIRSNLRNLISKTKSQEIRKIKNRLSNVIKTKILKFSNDNWSKKLKDLKMRDNSLWKTVRSFTKNNNRTIPILHGLNGLAISNREREWNK